MDPILCSSSAFRYHRVPPHLLNLYPRPPELRGNRDYRSVANSPLVADILDVPLTRFATTQNVRTNTKLYRDMFIKHELPPGSLTETEHGFLVTSPAMTLLTMARTVSRVHLLMAAYELCGEFSVFHPCKRSEYLLDQAFAQGFLDSSKGWQRVENSHGGKTDLWKRPACTDPSEIESFCKHARGLHGIKKLAWAANHVSGAAASPFEAQASILLSLPRRIGGEGLEIKNNQRIALSTAARSIYRKACVYADILIEGGPKGDVVLECQGRSVHDSEAAGISDSNRTTALESMGYSVILLTFEQLKDPVNFETVLELIARKSGVRRKEKTDAQREATAQLRRELFIDWTTLGT